MIMVMNTPVPYAQGQVVQGSVVNPSAIASAKESGAYALGAVITDLIHGAVHAFPDEGKREAAIAKVKSFTDAFVSRSGESALKDENQRAAVEDVSQRTPPPQVSFGIPVQQPGIDYARLAAEIVRQQQAAVQAKALDDQEDAGFPVTRVAPVDGGNDE